MPAPRAQDPVAILAAARPDEPLTLALAGRVLADAGARRIAQALAAHHHLAACDLSETAITPDGLAALVDKLPQCAAVQRVLLSGNPLGDAAAPLLAALIEAPVVHKVHVARVALSAGAVPRLVESLRQTAHLMLIDLSNNDLGDQGAAAVLDAVAASRARIHSLFLAKVGMTHAAGAAAVARILAERPARSLTALDVSENALDNIGVRAIAAALGGGGAGAPLRHLQLRGVGADDNALTLFCVEIAKGAGSLSFLDLSANTTGSRTMRAAAGLRKIRPALDLRISSVFGWQDTYSDLFGAGPLEIVDDNDGDGQNETDVSILAEEERVVRNVFADLVPSPGAPEQSAANGLLSVCGIICRMGNLQYDEHTRAAQLSPVLRLVHEHWGLLITMLKTKPPVKYPAIGEPLGWARLRSVEVFSVVADLRFYAFDRLMVRDGVVPACIDLLFQFPLNNFLHHAVQNLVVAILRSNSPVLRVELFEHSDLARRILHAFDIAQRTGRGARLGYFGHLTRICNALQKSSFVQPWIRAHLDAIPEWRSFCVTTLMATNEREARPLCGQMPVAPKDLGGIHGGGEFPKA